MATKRHLYAVHVRYGSGFTRGGIDGKLQDTILSFTSLFDFLKAKDEAHRYQRYDLIRVDRRFVEKEYGHDFFVNADHEIEENR